MNYDDFPILNDENYKMIQSQYDKFLPFNRKTCIDKIYILLEECRHFCFGLDKRYNKNITISITNVKKTLEQIMDNFHAVFQIDVEYKKQINEFNIFTFIKKIITCIIEIKNWNLKEEKEYYKKLSNNCLNILLNSLSDIISALEKSNLIIFKYM